jgi:hypothetical protein
LPGSENRQSGSFLRNFFYLNRINRSGGYPCFDGVFGHTHAFSSGVAQLNDEAKIKEVFEMKAQNIIRMQAIVIGLGAALMLASSTPAQEIANTSFNDGPNVAAFEQPTTTAAAQVSAAPAAVNAPASAPAAAVAVPVAAEEAMVSFENSAERWLIAASFFGIMMLAVYAVAEVRRSRKLTERPSSQLQRTAAFN